MVPLPFLVNLYHSTILIIIIIILICKGTSTDEKGIIFDHSVHYRQIILHGCGKLKLHQCICFTVKLSYIP